MALESDITGRTSFDISNFFFVIAPIIIFVTICAVRNQTKAKSETGQTSKMELFAKIGLKVVDYFHKNLRLR